MDSFEQSGKPTYRLDMIARNLVYVVAFLLPLAVLPGAWMSLAMTKMAILSLGVLGALLLWLVTRLREHRASFPDSHVLWTAALLLVGYVVTAVLSSHVVQSLIGFGYEIDTTLATATFIGALGAVAVTTRKVVHIITLQKTMLASFVLLAIFQIARIVIGGDTLLPSVFSSDPTASLLGSWSDLAVFSGLAVLTSLVGLALFSVRRMRLVLYAVFLMGLFLLVVVNVSAVWTTLALLSLVLSVYIFGDASYDKETSMFIPVLPWARLLPSVVVLFMSLLFMVAGSGIGSLVGNTFGVSYVDVRPSWEGTMNVGGGVYQDSAILGSGPASFQQAWIQHKPAAINETNFWNTDFNFGVGYIPTAFVTGGLLVGILWLLFFAAFANLGYKAFTKRITQPGLSYVVVSTFVGAIYLWLLTIAYVPQTVILAYTFMCTGAAIAAARIVGVIRTREVDAEESYASGFAHTGVIVLLVVVTGVSLLTIVDRMAVQVMLSRAVNAANAGNLDTAEARLKRAAFFGAGIQADRLQTQVGVARLSAILNEEESDDADAQRARFQEALAQTISSAQAVVAANSSDYRNWKLLGDIYAQLVPLQIEGAYESAIQAYQAVQVQNPKSPLAAISLAQLALSNEDYEGAQSMAEEALKVKSNYTDAFYLLSQIAIAQDETDKAIAATESAVLLRPDNTGLLFQLGILHYSKQDYEKVIPVLERAVVINPNYSNALYFLGLAYDQTGNATGALAAFKRLATLNPDNADVKAVVVALESGQSALSALQAGEPDVATDSDLPITSQTQQ